MWRPTSEGQSVGWEVPERATEEEPVMYTREDFVRAEDGYRRERLLEDFRAETRSDGEEQWHWHLFHRTRAALRSTAIVTEPSVRAAA